MSDRDLNRLAIEVFRKLDGVAYRFSSLTGKAKDEIAVDDEAEVVAITREAQRSCTVAPFLMFLRI